MMAFSDALLQDSMLTEERILQELEVLRGYFKAMTLESTLLPALEDVPLPVLVAILEPDEQQRPRLLNQSFLPLDKDDAEYTKFIQFYLELQDDVSMLDRTTLLEMICALNAKLPIGAAVLIPPRPELDRPQMVGVRMVQGFPLYPAVDQGTFTEDVFLFDLSCTIVSTILDGLAAGKSLDEAFAVLGE